MGENTLEKHGRNAENHCSKACRPHQPAAQNVLYSAADPAKICHILSILCFNSTMVIPLGLTFLQ